MNIKSKFNIGDLVYSINNGDINSFIIKVIVVDKTGTIYYKPFEYFVPKIAELDTFENFEQAKEAVEKEAKKNADIYLDQIKQLSLNNVKDISEK